MVSLIDISLYMCTFALPTYTQCCQSVKSCTRMHILCHANRTLAWDPSNIGCRGRNGGTGGLPRRMRWRCPDSGPRELQMEMHFPLAHVQCGCCCRCSAKYWPAIGDCWNICRVLAYLSLMSVCLACFGCLALTYFEFTCPSLPFIFLTRG